MIKLKKIKTTTTKNQEITGITKEPKLSTEMSPHPSKATNTTMNQTFKTEVTQDHRFFGREMKVLIGLMEDSQNNSEQQETGSVTTTSITTTTENSKHKYKNIKNKYIYNKNNNDNNNIKNVP